MTGKPTKAIVRGISRIRIKGVRLSLIEDALHIEIDILLPRLLIQADFEANVKFNVINSQSKGSANITTTNVSSTIIGDGVLVLRNGQKYMKLTKLSAEPKIGGFHIEGTGFMPNPDVNRVIIEVINQTWDLVAVDMVRPLWEPTLQEIVTSLLSRVPFNRIVP